MTHISESDFETKVEQRLIEKYDGVANSIERQKWLSETRGYADFWVDLGEVILAIELENDADSIRPGCAQAIEYASNDRRAVPVVYTPHGHSEQAVVRAFRARGVVINEVET